MGVSLHGGPGLPVAGTRASAAPGGATSGATPGAHTGCAHPTQQAHSRALAVPGPGAGRKAVSGAGPRPLSGRLRPCALAAGLPYAVTGSPTMGILGVGFRALLRRLTVASRRLPLAALLWAGLLVPLAGFLPEPAQAQTAYVSNAGQTSATRSCGRIDSCSGFGVTSRGFV